MPSGGGLFIYGTLVDPALRRAVLGPGAARTREVTAELAGYRAVALAGGRYPALRPAKEARVDGLLLTPIDGRMLRRLSRYEGRAFRLRRVTVNAGSGRVAAGVFVAAGPINATLAWDRDAWRRRFKRALLAQLRRKRWP